MVAVGVVQVRIGLGSCGGTGSMVRFPRLARGNGEMCSDLCLDSIVWCPVCYRGRGLNFCDRDASGIWIFQTVNAINYELPTF